MARFSLTAALLLSAWRDRTGVCGEVCVRGVWKLMKAERKDGKKEEKKRNGLIYARLWELNSQMSRGFQRSQLTRSQRQSLLLHTQHKCARIPPNLINTSRNFSVAGNKPYLVQRNVFKSQFLKNELTSDWRKGHEYVCACGNFSCGRQRM